MSDQVINADMARAIQADATRQRILFAWIIQHDPPEHPGRYVARFATEHPTVYVLVGDTLAEVQGKLPPGLDRSRRMPDGPPDVVEIWFSA